MCVEEVTRWFLINGLLLNASKTEAIAFGREQKLVKGSTDSSLKIGVASLAIVDNVKLLGIIFDSTLSMDNQVNAVVKACNFHIRALQHMRSCLTPEAARTISIGLVTSKLDYCNSLLYGTSESNLNKLQRVQNDLARVVLREPWRCHAAPLLQDLHWLPIRSRIKYKVALMTYKACQSKEPSYLYSLLHDYIPTRVLRSSDQHLLENLKSSTAKASRAFRHSLRLFGTTCQRTLVAQPHPGTSNNCLRLNFLRLHSAADLFFLCIRVILTDESLHVKPIV